MCFFNFKIAERHIDKIKDKIFGAVYLNDTLQFFGSSEGRVRIDSVIKGWVYDYYLSDHLGNTRMMITDDYNESSPILEAYSYYPFGLQQKGIDLEASGNLHNKYLYNKGSELQADLGVDLYATQYRSLDPQLGRFWQIDPKPQADVSLYSAMGNNPILYNDPLGDTVRIQFNTGFLGLGGKKKVDYNNGKLTNTDGSDYTGKVKGFLKKAVGGLDRLASGGKEGKSLVNDILNSKETVNIIRGDNNFNAKDNPTGMTNVVRWAPSNTAGGPDATLNQDRPAFIGLGHELAHADDQVSDGVIDYSQWYQTSDGKSIPKTEIYSTHIENNLRAENGIQLRAFYSICSAPLNNRT